MDRRLTRTGVPVSRSRRIDWDWAYWDSCRKRRPGRRHPSRVDPDWVSWGNYHEN
jgi:hypothetical protein